MGNVCDTYYTLFIFFHSDESILFDFSLTVKVAPHECVVRTGQP